VGRARNPGSQGRHQSAVGRVGEQTPEKCVQGEEGKKEHPLLVTNILCNDRHRSILGDLGDGHAAVQQTNELGEVPDHLGRRRGSVHGRLGGGTEDARCELGEVETDLVEHHGAVHRVGANHRGDGGAGRGRGNLLGEVERDQDRGGSHGLPASIGNGVADGLGEVHFVLFDEIFLGEGVGVNKLFRNSARVMGAGVGKLFVLLNINVIKSNMFSLGLRFLKRAL